MKGHVRYDHVSFHYSDDETPVLSDISIDIPAGRSIALVGPSGSGKTTICSLLPRFYDVTDGSITVDGKDIRGLTLKSLRSQIGMVQQDVYLFDGTIKDNIAYGKPGASDEEIIKAAKCASIHDFIMELPDGYDMVKLTISGEEVDALLDRTGNYALFYGVSSTGETGWFRYNVNDGTIQGYAGYNMADEQVINTNTKTADSDKAFNTVSSYIFVILAVLAVVIIALIVVVIALSIKLSKSKKAFVGAMDGYEDEDIDEEDLDDMELEDDEEDILYDDLEEDIDEEVSDDAVPYQSSTTKDLPEEYNESEELELEEIDDK